MRHSSHQLSSAASRPRTGISVKDAFARWADPEDVKKLIEYSDAAKPELIFFLDAPPSPYSLRHAQYCAAWERCLDRLMPLLRAGEALASGIAAAGEIDDRRKPLHPSLWDILELHLSGEKISGGDRCYLKPEFFEAARIPMNIDAPPDWLSLYTQATKPTLRFDANYERVFVDGEVISCGAKQSLILRQLHQAALRGNPWCDGKTLLTNASSQSASLRDLLKGQKWRRVIESDRRGRYRLLESN